MLFESVLSFVFFDLRFGIKCIIYKKTRPFSMFRKKKHTHTQNNPSTVVFLDRRVVVYFYGRENVRSRVFGVPWRWRVRLSDTEANINYDAYIYGRLAFGRGERTKLINSENPPPPPPPPSWRRTQNDGLSPCHHAYAINERVRHTARRRHHRRRRRPF